MTKQKHVGKFKALETIPTKRCCSKTPYAVITFRQRKIYQAPGPIAKAFTTEDFSILLLSNTPPIKYTLILTFELLLLNSALTIKSPPP